MPYVIRDTSGRIVGIYLHHNSDVDELQRPEVLSIENPEIINFLTQAGKEDAVKELLDEYDIVVPRILEDLIDLLIRNKLIKFEDFPEAAQKTLRAREYLREVIRQTTREMKEK